MIVSAWTSSILGHFKNQPQTCVLDSPSLDGAGFAGQVDMMPMIKDTVEDHLPLTFFGGKRGGGLGLGNWAPGKRQPSNQPRGVLFQAPKTLPVLGSGPKSASGTPGNEVGEVAGTKGWGTGIRSKSRPTADKTASNANVSFSKSAKPEKTTRRLPVVTVYP